MNSKILWGIGLILLGAAFLTAAPTFTGMVIGNGKAEGSFDRNLTVTGPVDLSVATGSGAISVNAGGSGTVHVVAHIQAHGNGNITAEEQVKRLQQNPPIEQNGNTIRIGQINDDDLKHNVSISYELTVPADTRLSSATGSGDQTIADIKGPVHATSGSGELNVRATGGGLELQTGSGHIEAQQVGGAATLRTGSGEISFDQTAPGEVRAETGSGGIELRGLHGRLRALTGSGHINVTGAPEGGWQIQAGSGEIDVAVPSDANFDLDARAGSGGIHVDLPVTMQGTFGRHELQGKVGSGGPTVQLRTGSGSIQVHKATL